MIHITKDLQIKRLGILTFYERLQWKMIVLMTEVYIVLLKGTLKLETRVEHAMEM